MLSSAIGRVVDLCARRAWPVLAAAALLAGAASIYTARHMAIDTDVVSLFPADLPWRQREVVFDAAFPQRVDLIAVVVDGATPELAEQATAALARRLSERPELFRTVRRPDGGPFFDRNGMLFLSTDALARTTEQLIAAQPLLGSLAADPSMRGLMDSLSLALEGVRRHEAKLDDLARPLAALAGTLERVIAGHPAPLSWRTLITGEAADRRELRRFILVQPVLDFSALQPGSAASAAIRQSVEQLELTPEQGVRVRLTGSVPLGDEEFSTIEQGAALNAALTVVAVLALLWLALRSGRIVLAVALNLVVGLAVTAAFGLLAFGRYNLISVAFAVLYVGLGVDFAIQFCVRYRAERHVQDDLRTALRAAGAGVGGPLALAAASTAAGFYSFVPTAYRGASQLGLIAGTGMLVGFLVCITVLPALLRVLRPPGEPDAVGYAALAPLERFLTAHRRAILIATGLVAVGCAALLPRLRFDFNPLDLRSPKTESVATLLDLMQDPATTPNTIDVLAPSLREAQSLAERLSALPQVAQAVTLASYVPQEQQKKLALIADAAFLLGPTLEPVEVKPQPTDRDTVRAMARTAQALRETLAGQPGPVANDARRLADALSALTQGDPAARARAQAALIPGLRATLGQLRAALHAEPVSLESLPSDLVRDWVAPDGRARVEVFPAGNSNDNETLRRFVAAVLQVAPDAGGTPVSIQQSSRTIVRAFAHAGLWAVSSITILLWLALRRIADVALTLAPLLLAGLATLGFCVVIDLPLNFANIIALPLLFGIGVAFNIYFVMAWRSGTAKLLQSSLTRAVLFSALATTTAFGSLWFSRHPGTASMGELLALALACTLASALVFLPGLLGPPRGIRTTGLEPVPGEQTGEEHHDVA
ncbi:MAG TPA: MMPL family transporter [Burkholderiales bacterium]|nr:MMPL family transporter [Burkholderiales bacterium]